MKKIIITGGTGFIGRNLIRRLSDGADYAITLVTRRPDKIKKPTPRINFVSWDKDDLFKAVEGAYAVVNLAGEPLLGLWTNAKRRRILESRVLAGISILRAIEKAAIKPKILIQASAVGYYGHAGDTLLDEFSPRGEGFLADVCKEWEHSTKAVQIHGVRRCVIRSGIVLGDDGFLPRVIQSFRFRIGLIMGNGEQWVSWIHIEDEIEAILFLMENQEAGGVYNLVSNNPITYRSLVKNVAGHFPHSLTVPLPSPLLKTLGSDFAREVLLAGQRVLPRRLSDEDFPFMYEDIEDVLHDLLEMKPSGGDI